LIIRKPYAFFIKYFRLFHILFFLLSFVLIANTISLYEFFHNYISSTAYIVSSFEVINVLVNYIWIFILLLGLIIVMIVLIYKKKKVKFYIIQISIYIILFALYIISNNYLNGMTKYLVDIRIIKALHDILFVFCIIQSISMVLLFARATGFDIKNFDFDKELNKLIADESDREEVEIAFDLDINNVKTRFNKLFRNLKYFYLENKLMSLILGGLGIASLVTILILYTNSRPYKNISDNTIKSGFYSINYKGFYVDDSKFDNTIIDKESLFVIVDTNIKTNVNRVFNTTNLMLYVDKKIYTPNSVFNQYFTDFGKGYNGEEIKKEDNYYFVYKIPVDSNLENIQVVYNNMDNYYIKKIELTDLRNNYENGNYSVGDSIKINNVIFNDLDFNIKEVAFNDKFLVPYIFKTGKINYNSSFYVSPTISGNYDKSIIRVVSSNCDLISEYGNIYYEENEVLVKAIVPLKQITNLKKNYGYCYYETDQNVKNSNTVLLKINIRGNIYNYYLK